jgi:transcriptional regulator with XRE-family HTH domain
MVIAMQHQDTPFPVRVVLAANMRRLRAEQGLSQEALADLVPLHRTYIGAIERAERNPPLESVARIARALGVHITVLLTGPSTEQGDEHGA